jgi:hypothetical protein
MDDLMDMIVVDELSSDISDKIKEVLYTRAAEKVDNTRPNVALSVFDTEQETDVEVDAEE